MPVPSRSIEVSRISPAPSASRRRIHSIASSGVSSRPPLTITASRPPTRLTSTAATTHWVPKLSARRETSEGSRTAAVLTETLSAPARRAAPASATARMPPPTVNGMKIDSATRLTISSVVSPGLVAGGDVEEDELVGALGVVAGGLLDRVARVAQRLEVDALHHPAAGDVEAGDDPPR